jgi:hypothetical protein
LRLISRSTITRAMKKLLRQTNYQQEYSMSYVRTKEHRAMRSEMIHQWKPWLKSTGAKTEEGKRKSAMNAYKGGHRKRQRLINKSLNDCFEVLPHVTCSEGLL